LSGDSDSTVGRPALTVAGSASLLSSVLSSGENSAGVYGLSGTLNVEVKNRCM